MKTIVRGAEAVLYVREGRVVKERVKKNYRIDEIDTPVRKQRTRNEAKLLREARRAGVETPQIMSEGTYSIEMEFIQGKKVRDTLNAKNISEICSKMGESIGKLHSSGIIHGDLTTSNMIFKDGMIYFIDFGLGFQSHRIEDKAVDLRLLRQVLDSTHFDVAEKAWKIILKAYQNNCEDAGRVFETLQKIEKRGRYSKR